MLASETEKNLAPWYSARAMLRRPARTSSCPTSLWYALKMTKDHVKAVLDRVLDWPEARQEDAAEILRLMEEQDRSTLQLSDEQVAEVRRRMTAPSSDTIPAEEVFKRFRSEPR
jgi:hypothetical protein